MFPLVVSPKWLHDNIDSSRVLVFDCTQHSDHLPEDTLEQFKRAHIPGSYPLTFGPMDSDRGFTIPCKRSFHDWAASVGLQDDSQIILSQNDCCSLGIFTVWWVLSYYSQNCVSFFEGGLKRWRSAGYPVSVKPAKKRYQIYSLTCKPACNMLLTAKDVKFMFLGRKSRLGAVQDLTRYTQIVNISPGSASERYKAFIRLLCVFLPYSAVFSLDADVFLCGRGSLSSSLRNNQQQSAMTKRYFSFESLEAKRLIFKALTDSTGQRQFSFEQPTMYIGQTLEQLAFVIFCANYASGHCIHRTSLLLVDQRFIHELDNCAGQIMDYLNVHPPPQQIPASIGGSSNNEPSAETIFQPSQAWVSFIENHKLTYAYRCTMRQLGLNPDRADDHMREKRDEHLKRVQNFQATESAKRNFLAEYFTVLPRQHSAEHVRSPNNFTAASVDTFDINRTLTEKDSADINVYAQTISRSVVVSLQETSKSSNS